MENCFLKMEKLVNEIKKLTTHDTTIELCNMIEYIELPSIITKYDRIIAGTEYDDTEYEYDDDDEYDDNTDNGPSELVVNITEYELESINGLVTLQYESDNIEYSEITCILNEIINKSIQNHFDDKVGIIGTDTFGTCN